MKSDFKISCPYCGDIKDYGKYENWNDELLDDSDSTIIRCENCNNCFEVETHAVYNFTSKRVEI